MFSCYLRLEQLPDEVKKHHKIKVGAKIPRFDLVQMAGYYKPLELLRNNKGQILFYLIGTMGIIDSPDKRRADTFLQGKDSLNFTSVYLLGDEQPDGYLIAYGNPNSNKTFSNKNKPNPFFECRNDGYLFLISRDWKTIEILIVPDGKNTILGNAKALKDGVYNEALETMRATATTYFQY